MSQKTTDPKKLEMQKVKAELAHKQLVEDFKEIMATPAGIRVFRHIMDMGRMFSTTFTGNSQMYFLEGHRNMALQIFFLVQEACAEAPETILEIITKPKEKEDG